MNRLVEATIAELQEAMESGTLTARALVETYEVLIEKFDWDGPNIRSVIELNPDAKRIASELDQERRERGSRGPLHGIPILLKDNIDTGDRMMTTAGSLALDGVPAPDDATVALRLRKAGAVLLGKANMSEWANFRSVNSTNGWSARGGRCRNPYVLDRSPAGSSAGPAAAVSAGFCAAALGTETDGSIVAPSSLCGVVGIKPTVGLTSRDGVIPISHTQDSVGIHGRTVADAAIVLGALTGVDPKDGATAASEGRFHRDYTQFLDKGGLSAARIGVARALFGKSAHADSLVEEAIEAMSHSGATIIEATDLEDSGTWRKRSAEIEVLLYEFKHNLNSYLETRSELPVRSLEDVIAFNCEHAEREMVYFGQDLLEMSQEKGTLAEEAYKQALSTSRTSGGRDGIDASMDHHDLDALIAPTAGPAWMADLVNGDLSHGNSSSLAARAGYPLVSVPVGFVRGLPVNITFMGRAWSEPVLIRLAYALEQVMMARRAPQFLKTIE